MVLKELYKIWKKKGLLNQALEELKQMFDYDERMFEAAVGVLFEGKELKIDIYKEDKKINRLEMSIRKKILEHLSINPSQDVAASLLLLGVSRDVERIGDYCKNIIELSYIYKKTLEGGRHIYKLIKIEQKIQEMFDLTKKAFNNDDKKAARKAMDMHLNEITYELSKMLEDVLKDKKINTKKAVIAVLCSRYLKRISAHLMGIASSVVSPFDKIRHRTGKVDLIERKNVPAWKLKKK